FVNFENTEFCDGIDCDMWNIYKSGSIKNITAPNTITPIYNYGNEMNLYSATGMLVMQVPSWNGEAIDVAHLPAGIYFINIQSETIKFVKL
ncbi:MAG: T9SS type A sorting domain-containing protein, partial [Bacteroidaceae bacterium]|nr:T9SS type A sorting domain-containing protein [Bacteroidaceae bacterium]